MFPIFEQGKGNGIGKSFKGFFERFIEICEEHLENGNAKTFAFILYDFHDKTLKAILKQNGVFIKLDRLANNKLTIFYLDSENKELLKTFNKVFLGAFEVESDRNLPFVLFFDIYKREVENIEIVELNADNISYAFQNLYSIIENKISNITLTDTSKKHVHIERFNNLKKIVVDKLVGFIIETVLKSDKDWY